MRMKNTDLIIINQKNMLSKLFARTIASKSQILAPVFVQAPVRHFRSDYVNPYIHSPIKLSEQERTSQESVPVWDRAFDFKKYMEHDGPLKVTNFYNNELFI